MHCPHQHEGRVPPRTRAAIEFSIQIGLRRSFGSAQSFLRALRAYIRAFTLTHPDDGGRVPAKRCVEIARGLTDAPSRLAARYQADLLRERIGNELPLRRSNRAVR